MKDQLIQRLDKIALHSTSPFCYGCYKEAPTGRCVHCGSDDLMRLMKGVGCEWGTTWVVKELVQEIESIDIDQRFEDSIEGCYPEMTKIGWLEYNTVSALKELDPVSWRIAKSEWLDNEESEDIIMTFDKGSTYLELSEVEKFCEEKETELGITRGDEDEQ